MGKIRNLFDTPAQETDNGYVPSKKGTFTVLGQILTKAAVGMESPQALAQLQQRELEAETEFARYRQQRLDYDQERKERQAQAELDNYLKMRDAGLSVPSSGTGLTGRPDMVQLGGRFYQQDPTQDIDTLLKKARLEKLVNGQVGEKQPSRFDLEKFASSEALRRVGGSSFVGLSQEAQQKYLSERDGIFNQLLKQYDVSKSSDSSPDIENIVDTDW